VKIVTDLAGTPIEITVYKVGNDYLAARSNELAMPTISLCRYPRS
jgi:hypothetical protein